MKCFIYLLALFSMTLFSVFSFADDALTLPEKVWRITNIFSKAGVKNEFDNQGKKQTTGTLLNQTLTTVNSQITTQTGGAIPALAPATAPETSIYRYDLALEYGLTSTISLQAWVPFYLSADTKSNPNSGLSTFASSLRTTSQAVAALAPASGFVTQTTKDGEKSGTVGDILAGVKWQFFYNGAKINDSTPNSIRAALALGTYIPTGTLKDPARPLDFGTTQYNSKSFVPGFRTYFDYQITNWTFINWMTENQFPLKGESKKLHTDFTTYTGKYKPGTYHYSEIDWTINPTLAENLTLESGLIWFAQFSKRSKYSEFTQTTLNTEDLSTRLYGIKPYAGVFYTGKPFPIKGQLSYSMPYAGRNSKDTRTLSLRVEAYLTF